MFKRKKTLTLPTVPMSEMSKGETSDQVTSFATKSTAASGSQLSIQLESRSTQIKSSKSSECILKGDMPTSVSEPNLVDKSVSLIVVNQDHMIFHFRKIKWMLEELHLKTLLKFKKKISGQHKIVINCYQIDSIQLINDHI